MTSDDDVGGYPEEFIEPLHPRYECPICFLALREPLQLPCGHRFCEICFSKIPERQNASKQCPLDRNVVPPGTAFKDVGCQREILDLRVRCSNNTRNCEWTGELREVKNHKNVCDFEDVECTNEGCTDVVQRQTLEDHVRRLCSHRLVQCPHCLTDCTPNELDEHIEEKCTRYPVQCLNNCTLEVPREDMKAHLLECPRSVVHCEYVNIGCTHKCPRAELSNHLDTYLRPHLNYAVEKIVFLETEMEKQQHGLFEKLEIQNKEIQQLEDRLQVQEDEFKVKFQQQEIQLKQILEELKKREANTDEVRQLHHRNQEYIWKINDYRSKARNILWEKYSENFYIKGFKFRMHATINIGNEVLVRIQLLKGKYDDNLSWPFKYLITISVFQGPDQGTDQPHKSRTINLTRECAGRCLEKPAGDFNEMTGIFGLGKIKKKDDLISIRFYVYA